MTTEYTGAFDPTAAPFHLDDDAVAHLRHLNPLPANTGDVLRAYRRVVVPEMNLGQLAALLRAKYLVDVRPSARVRGLPISAAELAAHLNDVIDRKDAQ